MVEGESPVRSTCDASPDAGTGTVGAVVLKGTGERLEADMVVIGAGVLPNTELLRDHVSLERDGSVIVDQFLQVQGACAWCGDGCGCGGGSWASLTRQLRRAGGCACGWRHCAFPVLAHGRRGERARRASGGSPSP